MKTGFAGAAKVLALATALTCIVIGGAMAQGNFEDAKLDAFAAAAASIDRLGQRWLPRIEGAASQSEAEQLRQQARSEMIAAIEKTVGITLDEYRQIAQAAQGDPGLRSKLEGLLKEKLTN